MYEYHYSTKQVKRGFGVKPETELFVKWYPAIKELVHRYNLEIKLDLFGYGKMIFYRGEEIGYFWGFGDSVELHFVKDYGVKSEVFPDWSDAVKRIEEVILEKCIALKRLFYSDI